MQRTLRRPLRLKDPDAATDVYLCDSREVHWTSWIRHLHYLIQMLGAIVVQLVATAVAVPIERPQIIVGRHLIETEKLQKLFNEEDLRESAEKLYNAAEESIPDEGHPTRAIGTAGHNATIEYILKSLEAHGDYWNIWTENFTELIGTVRDYNFTDVDRGPVEIEPLSLTKGTDGVVNTEVKVIPNFGCRNSDYRNVEGKVAVVQRGECSFVVKAESAGQFGAAAVLIWDPNETPGSGLTSGTLGPPFENQVAAAFVHKDWATSAKDGDNISLYIDADLHEATTQNILAETKEGDHDNVVMLGAHSDSVQKGPGINDNGSGTITLLRLAEYLSNFEVKNAVRLAWWSAEEEGLLGSLYYTEHVLAEEAQKIRLFMDYDMLASPNYVYEIYDSNDEDNPDGSGILRDMYIDWFESHGLNWTLQPFDGRSDYVGFLEIGIPSSGIDAGAEELKTANDIAKFGGLEDVPYDKCYHEACDDLKNPNYEAWIVNSKLVAHSVALYARSLEGFPERTNEYVVNGRKELRKNRTY